MSAVEEFLEDMDDLGEVFVLLHNTMPVFEPDLKDLVQRFQNVLCLHHWRIRCEIVEDSFLGKSLMKIKPNRDRGMATIFIRKSLLGRATKEVAPLLLHEMLHLVLEPLVEEHAFQVEHEVTKDRANEYNRRFIRCLERVVDLLSSNLTRLIVIPSDSADDHAREMACARDTIVAGLADVRRDIRELEDAVREYDQTESGTYD